MSKYYFQFVFGGTDPELFGPYDTPELRDKEAKEYWAENGGEEHDIFRAMVDDNNDLHIGVFVGDELADETSD